MGLYDDDFYSSSSYSSGYNQDYDTKVDDTALNVLGGAFLAIWAICILIIVLNIIALWKIFSKAGEQGWKSIIPIYNCYTLFKITWNVKFFWIVFGITIGSIIISLIIPFFGVLVAIAGSIVTFVITIMMYYYLSRTFGQGIGFTIGLVFLTPIFFLILGFKSQYVGNGYQICQKLNQLAVNPNVNMV